MFMLNREYSERAGSTDPSLPDTDKIMYEMDPRLVKLLVATTLAVALACSQRA